MNRQPLCFILLLSMCLTLPLIATAQIVSIPDPNLRTVLETALGKASGAPITADEMATLTRLDASEAGISNLTGLEDTINLIWLSLGGNNISDISALTGLTNLSWLNLKGNDISDISPLVENTGLGSGDRILLHGNLLNRISINIYIPTLHSRGVTIEFDGSAQLNIGEPRTVRLIYFTPSDRPYRADVVQRMKDEILSIQTFYAEQMQAHGYGFTTFRVETDSQGEPMVHHVNGRHPDSYYLDNPLVNVFPEIDQTFNRETNIYLIVIDNSIHRINSGTGCPRGVGGRRGKYGGFASVSGEFRRDIVAHELGHAFGLLHDFSDGSYIMSYGPGANRLSPCHAKLLSVHPYFNPDIPIEWKQPPTIELISSPRYPAGAKSIPIQLKVSDSDGLHQVLLYLAQPNRWTVRACRGLTGEKDAIVQFDYDGTVPAAHDPSYSITTSLANPVVHPIHIQAVDVDGNIGGTSFTLFSEALQPLSKISGDNQHGLPNTQLSIPFVVEAWDLNDGSPRRWLPVTFTVTAGGGTLNVTRPTTNERGRIEGTLTLGPNLGTNTVEVSADGIEDTLIFNAVAGTAVALPDPNLRAAVEIEIRKAAGEPIAPAEMLAFTCLQALGADIRNLTGLEGATNLTGVILRHNNISDISPMAGLTNLRRLDLQGNNISDISPVAGLTELADLLLQDNNISDISPVAGLTILIELNLSSNNISDISSVAGLTDLGWLDLERNHISDISPVAGLTNLTGLNLSENGISDISPLVVNTGLGSGDKVDVRGNPLSYQSIHAHIPTLQSRGVTVEFDNQAPPVTADINGDGSVNLLDLVLVSSRFGNAGTNLAADVNSDGSVNILDLVLVAGTFDGAAAAPSAQPQVTFTAVEVQGWLTDTRILEVKDPTMKRGLMMLEQLLVSLIPVETKLLANYPNPFNPETWIPYRLAEDAFVTLTIYDGRGQVVRTLNVGHRIAAVYENQSKAIYWDGKNGLGEQVASGVYFYTLTAGRSGFSVPHRSDFSATRKMMILK